MRKQALWALANLAVFDGAKRTLFSSGSLDLALRALSRFDDQDTLIQASCVIWSLHVSIHVFGREGKMHAQVLMNLFCL